MDNWRQASLGDLITLKRGYDLPTSARSENGLIPVVSSSGVSGFHDEAKVHAPGVVTGRYGTVGQVYYIDQPFWPLNTTLYVKDFKGNEPKYVHQFLQSVDFEEFSDKTGVPGVNRNDLHKIPVVIPPLPEQRRIAEILGAWDEAIAAAERLIAALRERKSGLMQRLLTGEVRASAFVNSSERQQTDVGSLPSDWHYASIGEIARHVSSKNSGGSDLPVLSCTKHEGLVDSLGYFGRRMYSDDTSTYKVVRRHQFAYATNHIEEGSIGYQDLYDAALISPMYTVFEATDTISDLFLYALLKSETYRRVFERNMSATVDRRGSLRWPEFSRIRVPVPPLPEQTYIVQILQAANDELAQHQRRLDLLRQQKRGLMQRLLTGELRVKVAEAPRPPLE